MPPDVRARRAGGRRAAVPRGRRRTSRRCSTATAERPGLGKSRAVERRRLVERARAARRPARRRRSPRARRAPERTSELPAGEAHARDLSGSSSAVRARSRASPTRPRAAARGTSGRRAICRERGRAAATVVVDAVEPEGDQRPARRSARRARAASCRRRKPSARSSDGPVPVLEGDQRDRRRLRVPAQVDVVDGRVAVVPAAVGALTRSSSSSTASRRVRVVVGRQRVHGEQDARRRLDERPRVGRPAPGRPRARGRPAFGRGSPRCGDRERERTACAASASSASAASAEVVGPSWRPSELVEAAVRLADATRARRGQAASSSASAASVGRLDLRLPPPRLTGRPPSGRPKLRESSREHRVEAGGAHDTTHGAHSSSIHRPGFVSRSSPPEVQPWTRPSGGTRRLGRGPIMEEASQPGGNVRGITPEGGVSPRPTRRDHT